MSAGTVIMDDIYSAAIQYMTLKNGKIVFNIELLGPYPGSKEQKIKLYGLDRILIFEAKTTLEIPALTPLESQYIEFKLEAKS